MKLTALDTIHVSQCPIHPHALPLYFMPSAPLDVTTMLGFLPIIITLIEKTNFFFYSSYNHQ